ncbi:MAG: monovalent cation/H+ antiporter subunit D family protein [Dongiaceae bacterium]
MSPETTVAAAPLLPLVGAVLIWLAGRRPNLREGVTLVTAGLLFLAVASLLPTVLAGGRPAAVWLELLPGLAIAFRVEPLGMLFALVASLLWIPNSVYSIGYMRAHREEHQTRFYVCFAVALACAVGVAFAANLLTLFLFYEMLTLSTYPLVTHAGTQAAMRSGRLYLGILIGTSIGFFLLAILWTYAAAGTLDFRPEGLLGGVDPGLLPVLLALYVFGIGKAAVMPFHRWLPAAMVAPTPVSALLHAVAVVKAGVFAVLKVVVYVFGLDLMQAAHPGDWLIWLAAFTILAASLVALGKDNLKARLAYSTISQLSYVVLGALLATTAGIVGGGMQILMHAFGKITLFFCAGAIIIATHKENVSEMRGVGRTMPFTMFAFLLGSLSVIGLPPFGGSWSKWYLMLGALDAGRLALVAVLMASSLLNIAYLLPVVVRSYFPGGEAAASPARLAEAPLACVVPALFTGAACLALFLYPDPFYRLLLQLVAP